MGCLIEKLVFKRGVDKIKHTEVPHELWGTSIKDIDGNYCTLGQYVKNNKAFIFVNVACK